MQDTTIPTPPTRTANDRPDTEPTMTSNLFPRYLDVVNRALEAHREAFPGALLESEKAEPLRERSIGVAVWGGVPATPHEYFTIELDDGRFTLVDAGKQRKRIQWRIMERHLEEVVEDPEPYVEAPEQLDLNWIRTEVERN